MSIQKRYYIIGLIICLTSWATSCSNSQGDRPAVNRDSDQRELAALMRVMEAHGDEMRKAIRDGTDLPARPESIEHLLTAVPTTGMHINAETFPVFAKQYQRSIDALYAASLDNRASVYNAVIQSCSNCHTTHCPGPLMKIDKMFISE